MTTIVAELATVASEVDALRRLNIPDHRQAYSDRTAWLMSCLSELAYLRFNSMFSERAQAFFEEKISELLAESRTEKVRGLINSIAYDPEEKKKELERGLSVLDMKLEESFDRDGTQAILVSCKEFIAVAFRGTEAMSIRDIRTDTRAETTEARTEGRIHLGFDAALVNVQGEIQNRLDSGEFDAKPLFLTGHSLGGALATLASKRLVHAGGIAACYTFGAPRVGDEEWIAELKGPIYRLVNAADCVTMLPPGAVAVQGLTWLLGWIPALGPRLKNWLRGRYGGYMHGGDMRYLSNCRAGHFRDVRLLYHVSFAYRIKGFLVGSLPWKKFLADHKIANYREKLMILAVRRNLGDQE